MAAAPDSERPHDVVPSYEVRVSYSIKLQSGTLETEIWKKPSSAVMMLSRADCSSIIS
ncbi:MAG: hypothetical protein HC888_14215 [Candidatus Competibacteraceae bacterium]|nr:hypothetical protein [Candidatus Competibacteraceae bacterium]